MKAKDNVKKNTKKYIFNFLKWAISNTIWTIITLIIPFTILIPTAKNILKSITSKTYNINILTAILLVVFFVLETVLLIAIITFKRKDKKDIIDNQNEDGYSKMEYYFESYHKHLTVYKNGNGILINSFKVVINDINAISEFKREIDILDAKRETVFPKLNKMKSTKIYNRFNDFGFWYKCLNNKDLITSVKEYYWQDDSKGIDTIAQSNPRILKWIMEMNPSSIEVGKPYDIVYVMSIPGMFPIENGLFSDSIANIKGTNGNFKSQFNVKHAIKNLKYTVSFENGLILKNKPSGSISINNEKRNLHFDNDNNILFDKYIFNTTNPKIGSVVSIEWNFKKKRFDQTQMNRRT